MTSSADTLFEELIKPVDINKVKQGDILLLQSKPCEVKIIEKSAPGKHGHAKICFTGFDVFTGKRYSELFASKQQAKQIDPKKSKCQVIALDEVTGTMQVIDDDNETRDDIVLPSTGFSSGTGISTEEFKEGKVISKVINKVDGKSSLRGEIVSRFNKFIEDDKPVILYITSIGDRSVITSVR
jgi:translation elongation factor P/translation initiation factor 5A